MRVPQLPSLLWSWLLVPLLNHQRQDQRDLVLTRGQGDRQWVADVSTFKQPQWENLGCTVGPEEL